MKLKVLNLLALLLLLGTSNFDMMVEWWQRSDKCEVTISEELTPNFTPFIVGNTVDANRDLQWDGHRLPPE